MSIPAFLTHLDCELNIQINHSFYQKVYKQLLLRWTLLEHEQSNKS